MITKHGPLYWLDIRVDGKRVRRSLKTGEQGLALERAREIERDLRAPKTPGVDIHEFSLKYLDWAWDTKPASADQESRRMKKILEFFDAHDIRTLNDVTPYHLEQLRAWLKTRKVKVGDKEVDRPRSQATVNRYMELLRSLFNLAIEDGILRENPMRFYQPYAEEGTRRALSDDELRSVLAAAAELEKNKSFRLRHVFRDLILFGLATGMRLSEILNLRRSWISGDLAVLPLASTKSRRRGAAASKQKVKVVGLNEVALEVIGRQPGQDEFVFDLHRRDPMVVQHGVEAIRRLAGIPDFTFHYLRHTVSTIVASQSGLATARVVLGHSDLRTTLRYTHPSLSEQRETVTKLGTYLRTIASK